MAVFNATLNSTKEASADQAQEDKVGILIGIVVLASALIGCSLALVALGKDLFIGRNTPMVLVGALVWVDFIGVFSTSVIVFHGFVKGAEWMADSPQCGLQAFFTTAFGLSSGAVVTSMSLDRVAALYKPFFYKQHATPLLTRTICAFLTILCLALAALPFFGIGKYKFNQSSRSFCQFDWFPVTLTETVYTFAIAVCGVTLITEMTASNIIVLVIVVRIRQRMSAVLPSKDMKSKRRARRVAFRQEEQMAKFVALASFVFLFTWLPVTVSSCPSPFQLNS
ncbi:Prostaglandin E2 receptor EP2 subtype [Stylophora pistillata]|uniref:Prostaglandin E2 receptor EP2 subtype n=1 Tax=Stylophora pistillata TaxID=50429 RepID=A0A2B4T0D6_STYPI|nr:Prostaglandin E2 receptor EP2 subtype [Stylophora pistillata]